LNNRRIQSNSPRIRSINNNNIDRRLSEKTHRSHGAQWLDSFLSADAESLQSFGPHSEYGENRKSKNFSFCVHVSECRRLERRRQEMSRDCGEEDRLSHHPLPSRCDVGCRVLSVIASSRQTEIPLSFRVDFCSNAIDIERPSACRLAHCLCFAVHDTSVKWISFMGH
jgi:hypothetical protein